METLGLEKALWVKVLEVTRKAKATPVARQPDRIQPPVEYALVGAPLRPPLPPHFQFQLLLPLRNTLRIDPSYNNKDIDNETTTPWFGSFPDAYSFQ